MTEEMGLQTFPENRHCRCPRDVQRQSVPQSGSCDRKSSISSCRVRIRVRVRIRFIVWLVSGYARVFILLCVVIVPYEHNRIMWYNNDNIADVDEAAVAGWNAGVRQD